MILPTIPLNLNRFRFAHLVFRLPLPMQRQASLSQDACCWAGLAFGFQIKPQMGLQLDGFGRFGQHYKAVGFGFGVGEDGGVVGKRFVH